MKFQNLKLSIFLILFGCSVSAFAQADNSVPNDKSSKKSVVIEKLDDIYPAGKAFVPSEIYIPDKIYIGKIPLYSQTTECAPTPENNVIFVKAQQGDTVETLAKRHGANPVEVAKFNGLFVNSKLNNGRKIKISAK